MVNLRTLLILFDSNTIKDIIEKDKVKQTFNLGNTASMAEENPVRLSVQAIKISSTPRFFKLLRTVAQNLALSFSLQPTSPVHLSCRQDLFLWQYILLS